MIVVGVIVAIAAVGGFIFLNKDDKKTDSNSTASSQNPPANQNTQSNNEDSEEAVEGSLETFRSAGMARKCNLSYSDSGGSGTGTMYTDGKGRGRISLNLTTERGNTGESNTLVTSEKSYSWTKTDGGSFGIVFDTKTIQPNSTGSPTTSSTQTAGKNFSMKCRSWSVDESILSVPSNVKFTETPITP